jgi:hypothetical protein
MGPGWTYLLQNRAASCIRVAPRMVYPKQPSAAGVHSRVRSDLIIRCLNGRAADSGRRSRGRRIARHRAGTSSGSCLDRWDSCSCDHWQGAGELWQGGSACGVFCQGGGDGTERYVTIGSDKR